MEFLADASIEIGGCVIETGAGRIDATARDSASRGCARRSFALRLARKESAPGDAAYVDASAKPSWCAGTGRVRRLFGLSVEAATQASIGRYARSSRPARSGLCRRRSSA